MTDDRKPNDDELIVTVRARALDALHRHDFADVTEDELPPVASLHALRRAETKLGVQLVPFLARLYREVANGAFGPGYGILRLPSEGGWDTDKQELLTNTQDLLREQFAAEGRDWPATIVPLCEWGSGVWSCVDCNSGDGAILTLDEKGLTYTAYDIRTLFSDWCDGVRIWDRLFHFQEVEVKNPFTGESVKTRVRRTAKH